VADKPVLSLLALAIALAAPLRAAEPAPAPPEKSELLSAHKVEATFAGLEFRRCLGLTSLCPEECGDSGEFATFKIVRYLNYEKPGEYGDPKQQDYLVQVSDFHKNPKRDPKLLEWVRSLKPGDTVILSWEHRYVTANGRSAPQRPLISYQTSRKE
jgi:hypothetical protein